MNPKIFEIKTNIKFIDGTYEVEDPVQRFDVMDNSIDKKAVSIKFFFLLEKKIISGFSFY